MTNICEKIYVITCISDKRLSYYFFQVGAGYTCRSHFLCGLISVFIEFAYIHCSKNINLEYVCISGPLAQSVECRANNTKVVCSTLIRTRFQFLCELISVFIEFAYIHCSKNITLEYVYINGPLAQSVERGAHNTKVMCSKLIRTIFHFLCELSSVFNESSYIHCLNIINLEYVCINPLVAQSVERGTNNGMVLCSRLIRTRFHFLFGLLSLSK